MKQLAKHLVDRMAALTERRSLDASLANAEENRRYVKLTIADLTAGVTPDGIDSAVVIGAGPSLHRKDPVAELMSCGYDGVILACDG